MTIDQAKQLYFIVVGKADYTASEWESIRTELQQVVEATSDRAGGDVIRWWDCWDRNYTATSFARKIREAWETMKHD